jgi:hypothetical protein
MSEMDGHFFANCSVASALWPQCNRLVVTIAMKGEAPVIANYI